MLEPTLLRSSHVLDRLEGADRLGSTERPRLEPPTLSRSSAEAEYRGVANDVDETCWLCNLLHELHTPLSFATLFFAAGQVRVLHVPSRYQFADIFTKGLPLALFEEFRSSLSVWCPPALTAVEC
ncbi:ribonuclease H-like domain-containing protein [Tanacetum coccineum]